MDEDFKFKRLRNIFQVPSLSGTDSKSTVSRCQGPGSPVVKDTDPVAVSSGENLATIHSVLKLKQLI